MNKKVKAFCKNCLKGAKTNKFYAKTAQFHAKSAKFQASTIGFKKLNLETLATSATADIQPF